MVVDLVDGRISVVGGVQCGYVYVDGLSVGEVTEASLKDRRILGDEGFVSVVIVVDSTSGKLVAGPEIQARGSGIDETAFDEIRPRIEEALARAAADGISDSYQLQQLAAPDRGQVGQRQLPPPANDHSGAAGGLGAQPSRSRRRNRCSLPVLVRGRTGRNSTARGYLYGAICCFT